MANNQPIIDVLAPLVADTHILYVKTRSYHWHVKGPHFKALHTLFEEQYVALAEAADVLAERIVMLGGQAPATLAGFLALKTLDEGDGSLDASAMIEGLAHDHERMAAALKEAIAKVDHHGDVATSDILTSRLIEHEKTAWVLRSSR